MSSVLSLHSICSDIIYRVLMFQMAVSMGKQIMSIEWVEKCWEHRNDPLISATDEHLVMYSNHIFIVCTCVC